MITKQTIQNQEKVLRAFLLHFKRQFNHLGLTPQVVEQLLDELVKQYKKRLSDLTGQKFKQELLNLTQQTQNMVQDMKQLIRANLWPKHQLVKKEVIKGEKTSNTRS